MPNDYDPDDPRYWLNDDEDDDRYFYYGSDDDEDDSPDFDCGFIPGYGCQLAGTEECDWECPDSHKLRAHPAYPNVTLDPISDILSALPFTNLKPPADTIEP